MTLLPALEGGTGDPADALTIGAQTCSWAQLRAGAEALAGRLAGADAVAVEATPTLATVTAVVAGLLAGVPVVPVPADAGPREREHILRDSGARLILSGGSIVDAPVATTPTTTAPTAAAGAKPPEGTALVLYTSGTTGAPKGSAIPASAIAADLDALAEAWQWTPQDVLVHGLPLYHVHGLVLGVLGALRMGCRLRHTGRPTPQAYAAAASGPAGGTLYFGVPTVWSRLVREAGCARALAGARLLVSGSAALPAPVFAALHALSGHRPVERYGMTETLITVSARAGGQRSAGTVGTALRGVQTRVAGEDGELQVRGKTLFSGYLGQPEATAASFTPDGWFRTGDAAVIEPDGTHRILGRLATDLIKSGGYRIGAGEVETALLAHPAVHEAAVVGTPDADLGQLVVAYVVAEAVTEQQLIDFVATELSVHKRPRRVRFVDALPRNAMGKVQKKRLS
jgi:fatty acid CoA ligase FadD36